MFPGHVHSLGKSFEKLHDLIRSRYLLAYKPAEFQANGRFRPIAITADGDGKRLEVHIKRVITRGLKPATTERPRSSTISLVRNVRSRAL